MLGGKMNYHCCAGGKKQHKAATIDRTSLSLLTYSKLPGWKRNLKYHLSNFSKPWSPKKKRKYKSSFVSFLAARILCVVIEPFSDMVLKIAKISTMTDAKLLRCLL